MYKKVLVPLDGSELAECALSHVKNLAKDGAVGEVTILNVFKVDITPVGVRSYAQFVDVNKLRESMRSDSKDYLTNVASRLASEAVKVITESLEGNHPADIIADYAQKNGVDLIIIATHGYTGMKKLMFGSVALGLLHECKVPILLIRP